MPETTNTVDWNLLLAGVALCSVVLAALWWRQSARHDATPVDVAWAANLGLLALLYAVFASGELERRVAIGVVGAAWSLRLAGWLAWHRLGSGRPEDPRYADLRARWGARANHRFFWFFQAQGLLDVLLSLPFLLIASNARLGLNALELVGLAIAVLAIAGETTADLQLDRFKKKAASKGRTCRDGLWRYSRHPNYFFEWMYWVGIATFAWTAPYGWVGIVAPAVMLYLLWNVTGIPLAEAQAVKSRGQDYLNYQRETSVFVPWFPRSST